MSIRNSLHTFFSVKLNENRKFSENINDYDVLFFDFKNEDKYQIYYSFFEILRFFITTLVVVAFHNYPIISINELAN